MVTRVHVRFSPSPSVITAAELGVEILSSHDCKLMIVVGTRMYLTCKGQFSKSYQNENCINSWT